MFHSLSTDVIQWAVAHTRARCEKKVAGDLLASGVPVFLPLMRRVTRYKNKAKTSQLPTFPGYVFFSETHFADNAKIPRMCRAQIAKILRPPDYDILKNELAFISGLLTDHELFQECVLGKPGDIVLITGGSLTGCEGKILRLKPNRRTVVLEISFLGLQLEAEVEEHLVVKR